MKKEYKKPIALIENFEIDEFVAGACRDAGKEIYQKPSIMNSNIKDCAFDEGGTIYFSGYCGGLDGGVDVFKYDTCYQGILGKYFAS